MIETERRFLLKSMPRASAYYDMNDTLKYEKSSVVIEQHYLSKKGALITERIREVKKSDNEIHSKYFHTIKKPVEGEFSQEEIEKEITKKEYDKMYEKKDRSIYKTRHFIKNDELMWEIDTFWSNELVIAEIELPSEDYIFIIPDIIKDRIIIEITAIPEFSNSNLAE